MGKLLKTLRLCLLYIDEQKSSRQSICRKVRKVLDSFPLSGLLASTSHWRKEISSKIQLVEKLEKYQIVLRYPTSSTSLGSKIQSVDNLNCLESRCLFYLSLQKTVQSSQINSSLKIHLNTEFFQISILYFSMLNQNIFLRKVLT